MCSVAGHSDPVDWVFSTSGFHRFLATKPVSSETSKAERWSNLATIVLFGTRGPWLFLVIREGLGSAERLGARGTQRLTIRLRLALEPECLENPTATARETPEMERTRSETLKLFVVSDVGRRSTLLSSTRSTRWWQSSWPRLDAPSPAGCPCSIKRCGTLETDRVCSTQRLPRP